MLASVFGFRCWIFKYFDQQNDKALCCVIEPLLNFKNVYIYSKEKNKFIVLYGDL